MEKKRSVGVTIYGVILIIFSAFLSFLGLAALLNEFYFHALIFLFPITYLAMSTSFLKLKNYSRKIILYTIIPYAFILSWVVINTVVINPSQYYVAV